MPEAEEPSPTAPAEPDENPAEGLAFTRALEPGGPVTHVVVVEADGSLRQVTGISRSSPGTSQPAWSPDRSQIAFGPPKVGAGTLYDVGVVNADGSDERVVGQGVNPQWSPDGSRILFEEVDDATGEPLSVYVADLATGLVASPAIGFSPRWLPDGERISFRRMVEGRVEGEPGAFTDVLYVMSLDGSEPEEVAVETDAYWSPDGTEVLLVHEGVISADADGSGPRELVDGYDPVWSPDGSRILFAYDFNQDALPILALVDREGHEIWSGVVGSSPAWSADGTRLAVEIAYPELMVQVLDAESGEVLWEAEGSQPAW